MARATFIFFRSNNLLTAAVGTGLPSPASEPIKFSQLFRLTPAWNRPLYNTASRARILTDLSSHSSHSSICPFTVSSFLLRFGATC
ncbi:hypothetical protein BDW75DRAFT_59876 [Aspergillus navahoensis]